MATALSSSRHTPLHAAHRVLIVSPVFPPGLVHGGGVAITFDALTRRLLQRGADVQVLTPPLDNLDTYCAWMYPGFRMIFPGFGTIAKIWEGIGWADVVVVPDNTCLPFIGTMCRIRGTPLLYDIHTNIMTMLQSGGNIPWMPPCLPWIIDKWLALGSHLSTQTFTTSPSYAADARLRGYRVNGAFSPRIKTAIFEDDNDTPAQIAAARDFLTCGHPERPILIHASRLSAEKRIEMLIAAKPAGSTVAIVGDGPQRDELMALHDPARGVCVHVGMVPQHRLRVFYKAADLLVSASKFETLGMTVIEAQLCGTPAVVQNAAGFVTQIDHERNGLLTDYDDAMSARRDIEHVLDLNLSAADVKATMKTGSWTTGLPQLDNVVDEVAATPTKKMGIVTFALCAPLIAIVWLVQLLFVYLLLAACKVNRGKDSKRAVMSPERMHALSLQREVIPEHNR